MLQRLEKAQANWGGVDKSIDLWLSDRKSLLIEYCSLAGLKPYQQEHLPSPSELREFCICLMDYTSAGHFEVYDKLVAASQPETRNLATQLYPQINATTDVILHFNDRYGDCTEQDELELLDDDLGALGEALSQRFELEDQLIANLVESRAVSA